MTLSQLEKMRLELRRGVLVLAVLAVLREPHYGYSLRQQLEDKGISIDEGTLYPLIRRLAEQGVLDSEWRSDTGRDRRYYWLSSQGEELFTHLTQEWLSLHHAVAPLLDFPKGEL